MRVGLSMRLVLALCGSSALAAGQARPLPGPDVALIYQRLLPQIEKIPIFNHHAHPGFADDLGCRRKLLAGSAVGARRPWRRRWRR